MTKSISQSSQGASNHEDDDDQVSNAPNQKEVEDEPKKKQKKDKSSKKKHHSQERSSESPPKKKKKKKHHKSEKVDGGSSIFTEKSQIQYEHKSKLREILNKIEDHPFSIEFRDPYPWQRLGQEDYQEIVGKCLDLRLIRKKLGVKNKYKKYKQFFKDLIRVFDNQKRYQQRGTRLYKHADLLQRLTRKLISRFKKDVNMKMHSDEARVDQISFEQREELGKKIIKLTKQSLSKLIEYLREHHSLCIEDDDEIDCSTPKENQAAEIDLSGRLDGQKDRIMIVRINELDKNRFMKMQGFVDELINRYYKIYGNRLGLNPENTLIL